MINIILLVGATCILAVGVMWHLVAAYNRTVGAAAPSNCEKQIAGYCASLVAASETAAQAVLSLGQLLESHSPLLPKSLSGIAPDVMDVLDARLVGVFQANIKLQDRLLSAETVIRKQQADIDRARREACTDPLTGLPNRRGLQDSLRSAIDGASRGDDGRLYFLMMDLDHFKKINDTLGHPAGDRVLKVVADSLQRSITAAGGTVARFGGEEFAAFLQCRTQEELALLAHNILVDVSAMGSASLESKHAVTISLGAAAYEGDESVESLAGRADRALYRAKWHGRNCAYYHNGLHVVPLGDDGKTDSSGAAPSSYPSVEQRQAERFAVQTVHRVAFLTEAGLGNDVEFHDVTCIDVSTKGLAFLSKSRPSATSILVDFSAQQGPTIFARIVSCQPTVDGLWRVACCFVRRVKLSELPANCVGVNRG